MDHQWCSRATIDGAKEVQKAECTPHNMFPANAQIQTTHQHNVQNRVHSLVAGMGLGEVSSSWSVTGAQTGRWSKRLTENYSIHSARHCAHQ